MMMPLWGFAGLAAGVYCIVRGIVDIRQRKYIWGALGILSAAVFLLAPVETHAVKLDLPMPSNRQQ